MSNTTMLPPHQRLADASVRHLVGVLQNLQQMRNEPGFDPFRNDQTKHKAGLVSYILGRYTPHEIDQAWQQSVSSYPSKPPSKPRSRGATGATGPVGTDPTLGGTPSLGGNGAGDPTGQGQGQGASQANGLNSDPDYPQRPLAGNATDPMAMMADALWPHMHPKVWDTAKAGDNALQNAIGSALKAIAAKGGTAQGTVTIQTAVTLTAPNLPAPVNMGVQHRNFPKLLKAANARMRSGHRLNIWLYGPPGTGKTTACEKLAEAMGLSFHANSALLTQYEVVGFRDAGGTVNTPEFRKAWENGGVYLLDEIDASTNAAVLALNAALANGFCVFPDKIVYRHADCIIVAGANTTGQGGTLEYVGRNKQDSTTLDRFVFIDWPLDEGLEAAMVSDQAWLNHVRRIRGNVAKRAMKNGLMITPRASVYGEALLAAGLDWTDVEAMTLRKGASDDVWGAVA